MVLEILHHQTTVMLQFLPIFLNIFKKKLKITVIVSFNKIDIS